jgi:hypothetical protein
MRNPNDRFYEKFHLTTKGKIAFRDGVLDFQNRKFYLWNEIDFEYYSTQQIERDFKEYFENPNHEIMELVKSKIYDLAFGEKVNTALQFFSRAISGHNEDKNWATYIGNRDCGKGVIYDSLVNAFESYVKSFELSMIQYQRQTESNETSRKLYWLLDLEFVRLGINQEIPSVKQGMKTCGKTLKKMTGGNDDMIARRNYDRVDTHFKIDTTFLIMGNNEILVDTDDAFEHRIEFHSVIQFKTQEEINQMIENGEPEIITQAYKIKDEDIKIKCTSDEWRNAMIYLLYEYYRKTPVSTERKAEEVVENENQSLRQKIIEQFNITCNQSDEILCVSVEDILDADKKKIKNELESMRVKKVKCKRGVNRDKNVYVGLKQKVKCLLEYDGNGMDETKS